MNSHLETEVGKLQDSSLALEAFFTPRALSDIENNTVHKKLGSSLWRGKFLAWGYGFEPDEVFPAIDSALTHARAIVELTDTITDEFRDIFAQERNRGYGSGDVAHTKDAYIQLGLDPDFIQKTINDAAFSCSNGALYE